MNETKRCTVRGHDHDLIHVRRIVQRGTGAIAHLWECPTGRYRYFVLDGCPITEHTIRTRRPRFGWSDR